MIPKSLQIEVSISDCCQDRTTTIPAFMGDPPIVICECCHNECTHSRTWKPVYEEIARGTYRKIKYVNKDGKDITPLL